MFELKTLSKEGVGAALERAERYRLLNEPREAESICRDILEIEPENQQALVTLLLSLTDQFETGKKGGVEEARTLAARFTREYDRYYYSGIIGERRGKASLGRSAPGACSVAYEWFREAMDWYEQAERIRPAGNDDALLRWNTCARIIMADKNIRPAPEDDFQPMLE